ncbi:hypothetical protein [Romboutsia sp. Marseille-P6047]|nr:hypothetical protein [Romboutsia sp. Marseille-P6047]
MTNKERKEDIKRFVELAKILREKDPVKFNRIYGKIEGLTEKMEKGE